MEESLKVNDIERKKKKKRESCLAGCLIGIGVVLIIIAILASIPVTLYEVYRNQEFQFQIKYPLGWEVIDKPVKGMGLVAFRSPRRDTFDVFTATVSITLTDLRNDPKTLAQFSKIAMDNFAQPYRSQIRILESKPITLAGLPGHRFSFEIPSKEESLRFLLVWTIHGDIAYTISCLAPKENFKSFSGRFNAVIKSFNFK